MIKFQVERQLGKLVLVPENEQALASAGLSEGSEVVLSLPESYGRPSRPAEFDGLIMDLLTRPAPRIDS